MMLFCPRRWNGCTRRGFRPGRKTSASDQQVRRARIEFDGYDNNILRYYNFPLSFSRRPERENLRTCSNNNNNITGILWLCAGKRRENPTPTTTAGTTGTTIVIIYYTYLYLHNIILHLHRVLKRRDIMKHITLRDYSRKWQMTFLNANIYEKKKKMFYFIIPVVYYNIIHFVYYEETRLKRYCFNIAT